MSNYDRWLEGGGDPLGDGKFERDYDILLSSFIAECEKCPDDIRIVGVFDYDNKVLYNKLNDALCDALEEIINIGFGITQNKLLEIVKDYYSDTGLDVYKIQALFNNAINICKQAENDYEDDIDNW